MVNQKLKEQVERKSNLINDVDDVIKVTCQRIIDEKAFIEQDSKIIEALASLVTARAMLN